MVNYDEEEKDDGSFNEDLRVVIKVAIFRSFIQCVKC